MNRPALAIAVSVTAAVAVMAVCASRPDWWSGLVAGALLTGALTFVAWRADVMRLREIVLVAIILRLAFVWLPPILSDDAYRYVWDGMIQTEGVNPYLHQPSELEEYHAEPVFDHLNSAEYYSVYPPLSQLIFVLAGLFYGGGWMVSFYVIKAVFLLLEMGGVLLLARMVEARNLLLYAWNPLVILEVAGQGHTEAAVILFLVLTVWLEGRGRGGAASAALACAGMVKLYPFVLFPYLVRRFGWRRLWPAAIVVIVLVAPYAHIAVPRHVAGSLDLYVRLFEFNAGLYYLSKQFLHLITGEDWSKTLGPAMGFAFLALLPVLYYLDGLRNWSLHRAFAITIGAFFVLTTTVHPWYLLGILPLAVLSRRPAWHWHVLSWLSLGTYLLYVGGPYWPWVVSGWTAWVLLAGYRHRVLLGKAAYKVFDPALQRLQKRRAGKKLRFIRPLMPSLRPGAPVLDLGAGEGYVGWLVQERLGADVVAADVVDLNRTSIFHVVYDGRTLPFEDGKFDLAILYFVLHHASDPQRLVSETLRVSRGPVIVVESTYRYQWERLLLRIVDLAANRVRSYGLMGPQEENLAFRTEGEWATLFAREEAAVTAQLRRGRWVHRQVAFVLEDVRRRSASVNTEVDQNG